MTMIDNMTMAERSDLVYELKQSHEHRHTNILVSHIAASPTVIKEHLIDALAEDSINDWAEHDYSNDAPIWQRVCTSLADANAIQMPGASTPLHNRRVVQNGSDVYYYIQTAWTKYVEDEVQKRGDIIMEDLMEEAE